MDKRVIERIGVAVPAVAERADFGPAYNGEEYITLTFRVPKEVPAIAGTWDLIPRGPGSFDWAKQKYPVDESEVADAR